MRKNYLSSALTSLMQQIRRLYVLFLLIIMVVIGIISLPVVASAADETITSVETSDTSATTPTVEVVDPFGRQTPRSTIQGFIKALSESNEALASNYLDTTVSDNAVEIVRQLKLALDSGGRIDAELQISNEPTGNLADQLPANLEKVGTITVDDQIIDIILIRKTADHGNQYWQFSPETIRAVKQAELSFQPTLIEKYTLQPFKGKAFLGYNLIDMFAVLSLAILCIAFFYALIGLFYLIIRYYYPKVRNKRLPFDAKVILPLALVLTSIVFYEMMVYAGVSVTVREPVNRIKDIVGWLASTWLLLRVADAVFNRAERQSYKRNQTERVSILSLLHKLVKALLLILASIFIFGNLGFDLTTGIAALGVGGLALALGAQKMIENLVGSVVVVADQPVRVGDYCKFGQLEGTVIDIGIRSTRLRTLDRTIVTVPNGEFSSMSIENFASRDMFHFNHNFYIKRSVDAAGLESFIKGMNDFLINHEFTNSEWNVVRVAELRQDCMVIEVRAYMYASDGLKEFYGKQTQFIIELLREIEKYPVEHALPTQTMLIEPAHSSASSLPKPLPSQTPPFISKDSNNA